MEIDRATTLARVGMMAVAWPTSDLSNEISTPKYRFLRRYEHVHQIDLRAACIKLADC